MVIALGGLGALGVLALGLLVLGLLYAVPLGLWIAAVTAGANVRISDLIGMRLRGVPPAPIVRALIVAKTADLTVTVPQLEAHHLAGGDVSKVMATLLGARRDGQGLTFYEAAALDLAERSGFGDIEALRASLGGPGPSDQKRRA